jgi:hypothetical protein
MSPAVLDLLIRVRVIELKRDALAGAFELFPHQIRRAARRPNQAGSFAISDQRQRNRQGRDKSRYRKR